MKPAGEMEGGGGVARPRAAPAVPGRLAAVVSRWATPVALTAATIAGIATFGPLLGMPVPPAALVVLALGALVVEGHPDHAFEIAAGAGLLALAATNKVYTLYHLLFVVALFGARDKTGRLFLAAAALGLWLPKHLFREHYHEVGFYNWLNEPSLALALFVTASWWRARRDGRLPPAARDASLARWAILYFFPGHAVNPMVYAPGDLFRERKLEARAVLVGILLVAGKALAHTALWRLFPTARYGALDAARAAVVPRGELWGIVIINYVDLALTLSGTADLAILIARLYGWSLPSPFRWALLAWNPGELWRRWGIYNRKWLLSVVYFPLGGSRHRLRNVMLTFLASGLVMHTGWFGSKYWEVGPGGWRDETLYFLLQGLLVCGYLVFRQLRPLPADEAADHALRLSWGRAAATAATQAASALAHVVVLAQALPFADRLAVMARCLGLR
jgi:hypothetical protein